jgi:predicted lipase
MFILILLLQMYTLVQTTYNSELVHSALNISQSAYCMSDLDKWTCATCTQTNVYENKIIHKNELVIVGYNKQYNTLFAGFRGSSNIQNWLDNLQVKKITPYDDAISVEDGFYKIYNALKNDLYLALNQSISEYGTNDVLFTGHSLGGAIATLFAFDICYYNLPYQVYSLITFGSPRVGNDAFSSYMSSCKIDSIRVTHYYDIVSHVPEEFLGYKHISREVWYNEINTDYVECDDEYSEDASCSDSCAPVKCTSISDHLNYLNISMGNDGLC